MKKILCFAIVILFCFPMLSCAQKKIDLEDDIDEYDFDGFEYSIYQGIYYEIVSLMPEKGITASGDRLLARYDEIKNKTGLHISVCSSDGISALLLGNLVSGTDNIDLINDRGMDIYDMSVAGTLYCFDDIGVSDCSNEKWGTESLRKETTFGGQNYGFFPYYWDILPRVSGMILCDMDGIANAGMTDPHEYIESGEWSWSTFRNELKKGTFVDENGTEHFGFLVDYAYEAVVLTFTAIYSNNSEPISLRNGRYAVNLSDAGSLEAIEYLQDIFHDKTARFSNTGSFYKNGPCPMMFYMVPDSQAEEIVNGFIPFPYGPAGSPETVSAVLLSSGSHGSNLYFAFPLTSKFNVDESGYIADLLFEPLDLSRPAGWKEILSESILFYDSDVGNYINAVENVHSFSADMINESYEELFNGCYSILTGASAVNETLSSVEPLLQNDLDKSVNK